MKRPGEADGDFAGALQAAAAAPADPAPATAATGPVSVNEALDGPLHPLVRHEARKVPQLEQFEGFVLRSFVESMLPSTDSTYFGKGTAGSVWRSMLAEQIGDELAKNGGIGIAAAIENRSPYATRTAASAAAGQGAGPGAGNGLARLLTESDLTRAAKAPDPTSE